MILHLTNNFLVMDTFILLLRCADFAHSHTYRLVQRTEPTCKVFKAYN